MSVAQLAFISYSAWNKLIVSTILVKLYHYSCVYFKLERQKDQTNKKKKNRKSMAVLVQLKFLINSHHSSAQNFIVLTPPWLSNRFTEQKGTKSMAEKWISQDREKLSNTHYFAAERRSKLKSYSDSYDSLFKQ